MLAKQTFSDGRFGIVVLFSPFLSSSNSAHMSGYKYEVGGVRGGAELGGRRLLARLRWSEAGASPGTQRLLLAGGCDWAAAGRRREQIGCGLVAVRSPDSSHQHQHHHQPWSSNDCPNAILVIISKTCVGTSLLDKRSTSSGYPHHHCLLHVIRSLDKYLDLDNRHNMCIWTRFINQR